MEPEDVKVIVLLSAFGSGSSAVAGFLDKCGAHSCPPHVHTNDPRTRTTFEPALYREALLKCFDEQTLKQIGKSEDFIAFFKPWLENEKAIAASGGRTHIVLKHPLQTFLLPAIDQIARPTYLVVTRPYEEIEQTRLRRGWSPVFGEAGAKAVYGAIYSYMHQSGKEYLSVP